MTFTKKGYYLLIASSGIFTLLDNDEIPHFWYQYAKWGDMDLNLLNNPQNRFQDPFPSIPTHFQTPTTFSSSPHIPGGNRFVRAKIIVGWQCAAQDDTRVIIWCLLTATRGAISKGYQPYIWLDQIVQIIQLIVSISYIGTLRMPQFLCSPPSWNNCVNKHIVLISNRQIRDAASVITLISPFDLINFLAISRYISACQNSGKCLDHSTLFLKTGTSHLFWLKVRIKFVEFCGVYPLGPFLSASWMITRAFSRKADKYNQFTGIF